MGLKHLTVGLRPELYRYFEEHAKNKGISISRYVEMFLEMSHNAETGADQEAVVPYSKEELVKDVIQAEMDADAGLLPEFEDGEKVIAYLNQ